MTRRARLCRPSLCVETFAKAETLAAGFALLLSLQSSRVNNPWFSEVST